MLKKVKKWLGIEGVKVELILPEEASIATGKVKGKLRFYSMQPQKVKHLHLQLIERYTRGRGDNRLVDEYVLGSIALKKTIDVPAEKIVEMGFELPFRVKDSDMDRLGKENILFAGISKVSKWLSNVKSEYRVVVEAKTEGVALPPFDEKNIILK
ncbi:MAG TPA: hypothetical protein ENJ45_00945 [Phaeodactylibacter sp.]|nr:hypothetical protein [Phaeodactylibacter sp.]